MRMNSLTVCAIFALTGCAGAPATAPPAALSVTHVAQVDWQPLNPARGDASPRAGTLWGDRGGRGSTAFLAKFVDGFSSPPHIHNVSYRAVVIAGQIHNDDPTAAHHWMPVGSFWTQPKGEAHITAARGAQSIALVEIDDGPYLVRPTDQAVDSGERPINIDATNLVWLPAGAAQVAYLWGDPVGTDPGGLFVRLMPKTAAKVEATKQTHAVVIAGDHAVPDSAKALAPGSAFSFNGGSTTVRCAAQTPCVLYVRSNGPLRITP